MPSYKYTFYLAPPTEYENKEIVVEAKNEKIAKRMLLKELHVLNKKFIRVKFADRNKEEFIEHYDDILEDKFSWFLGNEQYRNDEIEEVLKDIWEELKPSD
jgi:hypothetical protein